MYPLYEIGEGIMQKLSKTLSSCRILWMKLLKNQSLKPMLGLPMCGTGIEVTGFLCKIVFAYQFCQRNFEIFVNEPQQRCSSQLVRLLLVTICFTLIFCINWCKGQMYQTAALYQPYLKTDLTLKENILLTLLFL